MQLKEEFRTYETLRREHDAQIVQIATEAGLRIAPDQVCLMAILGKISRSFFLGISILRKSTKMNIIYLVQWLRYLYWNLEVGSPLLSAEKTSTLFLGFLFALSDLDTLIVKRSETKCVRGHTCSRL